MTAPRLGVRPREGAPDLAVSLLAGGVYELAAQRPDAYSMVVFFRGLHCPVCRAQLSELNRRLDEAAAVGIEVVAVSGETLERTTELATQWGIDKLRLGYGLTEHSMREWGLFLSRAIKEDEPPLFNEPGLFLIAPDGSVYYESILSMPVGRPRLDDLLGAVRYWLEHSYPARGEA